MLVTLLNRYNLMIHQDVCSVDFLVLMETESKAGEFVMVFNKRFKHMFQRKVIMKGKSIERSYQMRALCGG